MAHAINTSHGRAVSAKPPQFISLVLGLVFLCLGSALGAEDSSRIALVIGNAAYSGEVPALANPVNDAQDMASQLTSHGWKVLSSINANRRAFSRNLAEFRSQIMANPKATVLFFYAGHGVQVEGKNYLLPVDEVFENPEDIKESAFLVDRVVDLFNEGKVRQSVIILDACRDNPFARKNRSIGSSRGLTPVPANELAEEGSAVLFATNPGDTAQDGQGRNGLFTGVLLSHLDDGLDLPGLFKVVKEEVKNLTQGKQTPSLVTSGLLGDLYIGKNAGTAVSVAQVAPTAVAGSAQDLETGTFSLLIGGPVEGMTVQVDGAVAGSTPLKLTLSRGLHTVQISHPDYQTWSGPVKPNLAGLVELKPDMVLSTARMSRDLLLRRQALESRLKANKGTQGDLAVPAALGWISGGLGVVGVVATLIMGPQARASYDQAASVDAATAARAQLDALDTLYQTGILVGGAGIASGLLFSLLSPDTSSLESQLAALDQDLKNLETSK